MISLLYNKEAGGGEKEAQKLPPNIRMLGCFASFARGREGIFDPACGWVKCSF